MTTFRWVSGRHKRFSILGANAIDQPVMMPSALPSHAATGEMVWDRLWRDEPSRAKDDALLARERAGPRFNEMVAKLTARFGAVEGLRTIELGSGRGDLSILLAELGARVTLVDTSLRALDQARARFDRLGLSAELCEADLFDVPAAVKNSEVAISSGVIEHFRGDDRTQAIRAHYQVLGPGGMTVISVPHARCVPSRIWKKYLELRGWWPYGMEIPYRKRELAGRAEAAGFLQTEVRCTGFLQSLGGQCIQPLWGRRPGWSDRTSWLDSALGLTLTLYARRA